MAALCPGSQFDLDVLLPLENIREWKGCVQEVPPLALGEIRSLGLTLHPEVAKLYTKKTEEWRQIRGAKHISVPNDMCDMLEEEYGMTKPGTTVAMSLDEHPDICGCISAGGIIPEDLSIAHFAEPFTLDPDDLRNMPPGAQGLRLRPDLKAALKPGTVLGAYRSYMIFDNDRIYNLNKLCDLKHRDRIRGFNGTRLQMRRLLETFCVDNFMFNRGRGDVNACCDALGYGDASALLNDPVINPLSTLMNERVDENWYTDAQRVKGTAPVHVVIVDVRGWLYPVVVLMSEGKPGQELTYQYGAEYWKMILEIEMSENTGQEMMTNLLRSSLMGVATGLLSSRELQFLGKLTRRIIHQVHKAGSKRFYSEFSDYIAENEHLYPSDDDDDDDDDNDDGFFGRHTGSTPCHNSVGRFVGQSPPPSLKSDTPGAAVHHDAASVSTSDCTCSTPSQSSDESMPESADRVDAEAAHEIAAADDADEVLDYENDPILSGDLEDDSGSCPDDEYDDDVVGNAKLEAAPWQHGFGAEDYLVGDDDEAAIGVDVFPRTLPARARRQVMSTPLASPVTLAHVPDLVDPAPLPLPLCPLAPPDACVPAYVAPDGNVTILFSVPHPVAPLRRLGPSVPRPVSSEAGPCRVPPGEAGPSGSWPVPSWLPLSTAGPSCSRPAVSGASAGLKRPCALAFSGGFGSRSQRRRGALVPATVLAAAQPVPKGGGLKPKAIIPFPYVRGGQVHVSTWASKEELERLFAALEGGDVSGLSSDDLGLLWCLVATCAKWYTDKGKKCYVRARGVEVALTVTRPVLAELHAFLCGGDLFAMPAVVSSGLITLVVWLLPAL